MWETLAVDRLKSTEKNTWYGHRIESSGGIGKHLHP